MRSFRICRFVAAVFLCFFVLKNVFQREVKTGNDEFNEKESQLRTQKGVLMQEKTALTSKVVRPILKPLPSTVIP